VTVVLYVSRFPPHQQRAALEKLSRLGARASKRWVECALRKPSAEEMARRILTWVSQEFPDGAVDPADLAVACDMVAEKLFAIKEQKG
jgi:hypothetical protein